MTLSAGSRLGPSGRISARDRELGMGRRITRRDFIDGVAATVAVALAHGPLSALERAAAGARQPKQDVPGYYPPALTGLRGSGRGSFETAHALRDGDFWKTAGKPEGGAEEYDLVVVGGGTSGLAAAYFFLKRAPSARILILDNHDDFGGHAQRNEFRPSGRLLLGNGGSASIESPFAYSAVARGLMTELGVEPRTLAARCRCRERLPGPVRRLLLRSRNLRVRPVRGARARPLRKPGRRHVAPFPRADAAVPGRPSRHPPYSDGARGLHAGPVL